MTEHPDNIVPITPDARSAAEKFRAEHDRELLTILFTDLVDSTKLQSDLGNVEAARLTELHRMIIRDELANYDAREIEWAGDSCLAVFRKPSDSVLFALCMQIKHLETRSHEPRLPKVRVGIHLGEILVRQGVKKDDLFGLQVSETSRIMSVARGDQVYCSRAVFDSARGSLRGYLLQESGELVWARHGLWSLKGSEDAVEICEIACTTIAPPRPPAANEKCKPAGGAESSAKSSVFWKAAATVGFVAIVVLVLFLRPPQPTETPGDRDAAEDGQNFIPPKIPLKPIYTPIALPPNHPIAPPNPIATPLALSPDGTHLVYVGMHENSPHLILRQLGSLESVVLEGTEKGFYPFFSPDGEWLAFLGDFNNERKLLKLPLSGGPPQPIADISIDFAFSWGDDGYIFYTPSFGSGLLRISADGGEPEVLTTLQEGTLGHIFPVVLPGSKGVLYTTFNSVNLDSTRLMVYDVEADESRILFERAVAGQYIVTGHITYMQSDRLMAAPFDLETLTVTGRSFEVSESRMIGSDFFIFRMFISISGDLAYMPIRLDSTDALSLSWVDLEGEEKPLGVAPDEYRTIDIAPNGHNALASIHWARFESSWLLDLERNTSMRLTSETIDAVAPLWMADGQRFVFASVRSGQPGIHLASLDNPDNAELLAESPLGLSFPCAFTADESALIFRVNTAAGADLMIVELGGDHSSRPLLNAPHNEFDAAISPDGKWLAYSSDESGENHVYVCSYPDLREKTQIAEGSKAKWSPDGKTLYYTQTVENIWAVPLIFDPKFRPGDPWLVYEGPLALYDLHPDGDRFLVGKNLSSDVSRGGGREIIVVKNWSEEVRRKERLKQN